MNGYIKRLLVLLMCVTLVISAPASVLAAVAMPEPSVGAGEDSVINSDDKAEASTSVDILVTGTLEITGQTEDCLIEEGEDLELRVAVSGVGPFKYTWEVSTDEGSTWQTPDGAENADTYQITNATADVENSVVQEYIYKVTVEDKFGNTVSTEINISVQDSITYRRIHDVADNVAVSAWMLTTTELSCKPIQEGNKAYDELYRHLTPGCLPINAVDVALYNKATDKNFYIGEQLVEFIVGEEYEGQTLKVFQLVDGEVVEFDGLVQDGVIKITVDKLSQFMVEAPSDKAKVVTVTAGEGGSVTPNGKFTVVEGEDQRITFMPDEGYVIDKVLVDGEPVKIKTNYYDLENVKEDHTVEVTFKKAESSKGTYAVSVHRRGNGYTSPSGYFRVKDGESLTVDLKPARGYKVTKVTLDWSKEYSVVGDKLVIPAILKDTVIVVYFGKDNQPEVAVTRTITATSGEGGSISPAGESAVNYGGDMYYYFIPDEGYVLDEVIVDGKPVSDVDGAYHFVNVLENHTIHATFKKGDGEAKGIHTVTAKSGKNGKISPEGQQRIPEGGKQTFHFIPDSGYAVKAVYVNDKLVATTGLSYTINDIRSDTTIRVEFTRVGMIGTGDITPNVNTTLWWVLIGVAGGVAVLMIILIIIRRKKDDDEENTEAYGQSPDGNIQV